MKAIIAWILSVLTLLGGLVSPESRAEETENGLSAPAVAAFRSVLDEAKREHAPAEEESLSGVRHGDVDFADLAYERCDPTRFYDDADELCDLADAGDAEGACALFDQMYDELLYVDTQYTLAMIRHDQQIGDETRQEEYAYTENLWMEMADALSTAGAYALDSGISAAFSEHIGPAMTEDFSAYEPLTEADIERNDRETALQEEYYALNDGLEEISIEYGGETWTWAMLYGDEGSRLARRDYKAYYEIYEGIQKQMGEVFGPVLIELTQLWTETARDAGYDSYADYAYESYGRTYSPADAQIFCDAVKPAARMNYEELYYSDLFDDADSVGAELDTEALLAAVEAHLPAVDEALSEPWNYMMTHGLYDIAPSSAGRYDGSYTTAFQAYNAPFMFVSGLGGCRDIINITHEFGHYCDFYFNPAPDILTAVADLDLDEIHSNGLQALFSAFYPEIFGSGADTAAFVDLADLMENVLDGCMMDEFQRRLLAEADDLTTDRINEIYLELCVEYGLYTQYDAPDYDAGWAYVGHIFLSPGYYISYAASGFAALQIWEQSQADFDGAVETYLSVLMAGAYEDGYFAVLERAGLRPFTDADAVSSVMESAFTRLREMERAASRRNRGR